MRVIPWAAGLILSLGLICGCSQQSAATAEQIADAERALETVRIDSEQSKSERDAALAAIHTGVAAVLTSRDQLQQRVPLTIRRIWKQPAASPSRAFPPLDDLPILIVANDPEYMGQHVNGQALNGIALIYLVIILAAAIAAIPLLIITGAGQ